MVSMRIRSGDVSGDVVRNYRVNGIPATILIDKEGKIRERMAGFRSAIAQELTAKVAELTSEKP